MTFETCAQCEGLGCADNHVTGEVECSLCEGSGKLKMSQVSTVGCSFTLEHIHHGEWYILATGPDGRTLYDGYWNSPNSTIFDVLNQTLKGSQLDMRKL